MHFLRETCRRKLYYDTPLIIRSTEALPDNNYTPIDIYICAEGSTITFNNCSYLNKGYEPVYFPDCHKYFKYAALTNDDNQKCYMFMGDGFSMFVSDENSNNDTVRSFDFYWTVDNLDALYQSEISEPTISVQLYDMAFNPHRPWGIGTSLVEKKERLYLGQQVPWSTCIRKLMIRPADFRAFLGLTSNYIEINEAEMQQHVWPISDITPEQFPNRSTYQGEISVQISTDLVAIETETRQHTFLADVALAGGVYGLLTTLYVLLFGMNKLTPWGLVHNTTSMISRARYDKIRKRDIEYNDIDNFNSDGENIQSKPGSFSYFTSLFGKRAISYSVKRCTSKTNGSQQHFGNQGIDEDELNILRPGSPSRTNLVDNIDIVPLDNLKKTPVDQSLHSLSTETHSSRPVSVLRQSEDRNLQATIIRRPAYPDSESESVDQQDQDSPALLRQDKRTKELESRVDELEAILSQFFIDTSYLNALRLKEQYYKKKPVNQN
ncbi:hypothetical protein K501DRAFT_268356 [Backusella circina FSU 941]|nr:hypothetical protein K501DRAFT_268356 [Backusella circina FSU 941]